MQRAGLAEGGPAQVSSHVGYLSERVEITDQIMPGVVSLPYGWGHDAYQARMWDRERRMIPHKTGFPLPKMTRERLEVQGIIGRVLCSRA